MLVSSSSAPIAAAVAAAVAAAPPASAAVASAVACPLTGPKLPAWRGLAVLRLSFLRVGGGGQRRPHVRPGIGHNHAAGPLGRLAATDVIGQPLFPARNAVLKADIPDDQRHSARDDQKLHIIITHFNMAGIPDDRSGL